MTNGAISASIAGATGDRFVPAPHGRVTAINGTGVSIVAVSRCTCLASTTAAMVTDSASIVVVAGHGAGCITASSL